MADASRDHLAALIFSADGEVSRGVYAPGGFELYLHGGDALADRAVHHHEIQHALLTSSTAWGAALLVASRVPGWEGLFEQLVNLCRTTQESHATYTSRGMVAAVSDASGEALTAYPQYLPLVERLDQYLAAVPGELRRVWTAAADEVGVELITRQVADLPGIDLRMTGADWTPVLPSVRLVQLDLLRTESYVDLQALSDHQG